MIHLTPTPKLRALLAGACSAAALAVAPAAADASGTVSTIDDGSTYRVFVNAGQGDINDFEVTDGGDHLVIEDALAVSPVAGSGCQQGTPANPGEPKTVFCPEAVGGRVAIVHVRVGDGSNAATILGNYRSVLTAEGTGQNSLRGGPAIDEITGAGGQDHLDGGGGADIVQGAGGPDVLGGGAGGDVIAGGAGHDTVSYVTRTERVTVRPSDALANDGESDEHDNVAMDVEDIYGGHGNDELHASPAAAYTNLRGNGGVDFLYGSGGNDELEGGTGNDYLEGNGDADSLFGGGDDDILAGGAGSDYHDGGSGNDLVSYIGRTQSVHVDLEGPDGDDGASGEGDSVLANIERIAGGNDDDVLEGNAADNRITGRGGDDTILGRGGIDELDGDAGEDTIRSADAAADAVDCGADADKVDPDDLDATAGCETDLRPAAPVIQQVPAFETTPAAGPGPSAPSSPQPQPQPQPSPPAVPVTPSARTKVAIGPGRVRLTGSGVLRLTVACPAAAPGACTGTLKVRLGKRVLAGARFSVKPGAKATLKLRLGRKAIVRPKTVRVSATLTGGATVARKVVVRP